MKRIGLILLICCFWAPPLLSQQVYIPDTAFLHALIEEGVDADGDQMISYEEAELITKLEIVAFGPYDDLNLPVITDLTGIGAFVNLDTLMIDGNDIEQLDLTNNADLKYVSAKNNLLTSIDVSNCLDLVNLDVGPSFEFMFGYISNLNQLTTLDVSNNTKLERLVVWVNKLTELDVSKNTKLTYLDCDLNELTNLDVSNNPDLRTLWCRDNQITTLNVSTNFALERLTCFGNQLTGLDVSNCIALKNLDCWGNQLTGLNISNATSLEYLSISDMPSLKEVCVWEDFELDFVNIDTTGSPNVYFTTECTYTYIVYIPDTAFLYALIDHGVDTDGDSLISYPEAQALSSLEIWPAQGYSGCEENSNITDFRGIEAFTNLDTLICTCGKAESLNLYGSQKLKYLDCSRNQITSLDVSKNRALELLRCGENKISSLDVSNNSRLSELDLKDMPTLSEVCVWRMPFPPAGTTVDTAGSPNAYFSADCRLQILHIPDTALLYALVDVGVDTNEDSLISNIEAEAIRSLNLYNRGISELTGMEAFIYLDSLDCHANGLTSLDALQEISLVYLDCSDNLITWPELHVNTSLTFLDCSYNQFNSLDISDYTTLEWLDISHMPTLFGVCVWTIPFPPASIIVNTTGSSNAYFTTLCECDGDEFENNDERSDAAIISNDHSYEDLFVSVGDDDWYRITTDYYHPPGREMTVTCNFDHSDGDINIELLDYTGTILTSSIGIADNERIEYPVDPLETYFLRVYLKSGINNSYTLEINLPEPPAFLFQPHSVEFGQIDIYKTHTKEIEVVNQGDQPVIIDSIRAELIGTRITPTFAIIDVGESQTFAVDLFTRYMEPFSGRLTFYTNDSEYPQIQVPISGEGNRIAEFALLNQIVDTVSVGYWKSHILQFPNHSNSSSLTLEQSIVTYSLPGKINDRIPQQESETGTWITTSLPQLSVLAPGENKTFGITLDASGMEPGDYYADVALEWYSPEYHKGLIPIRMHARDTTQTVVSEPPRESVLIYPNPTRDHLTIQTHYPGEYSLEIISLNGQIILKREFSDTAHQINLSPFQKGIYFITIRSKDFVTTRKIIKL